MADIKGYRKRLQDPVLAGRYAARFDSGARKWIDRREQSAVRRVFAALPDCRAVLDVPSGAGRFLGTLSESGRAVVESDASREMLGHARKRAERLGIKAGFVQGDASQLPFTDQAVDTVFCNRLLHHILKPAERAMILRELHRVSRRHVVVSFFDYHKFGRVRRWLKALKGRKPPYQGQPTQMEFEREVAQCGFSIRQILSTGVFWVSEKYLILEKR